MKYRRYRKRKEDEREYIGKQKDGVKHFKEHEKKKNCDRCKC